jgi:hypothetical protein
MISIRPDETIESLERYLEVIKTIPGEKLSVPPKLDLLRPGSEASAIQLLITWANFSEFSELRIVSVVQVTTQTFATLCATACGYVALLIAKGVCDKRGADLSDLARSFAITAQQAESSLHNPRRPAQFFIICHKEYAGPATRALFDLGKTGHRAESRLSFQNSISRHISNFLVSFGVIQPDRSLSAELAGLLYELCVNSEEWGSTRLNGAPIKLPVRGLVLRLHDLSSVALGAKEGPLFKYIRELRTTSPRPSRAFELSVFDSGIGLAQRYLGKSIGEDFPIGEEFRAVCDCLQKHGTSSESSSRGIGLYSVMRTLGHLKAFLRVRTGRLHLFRNFKTQPHFYTSASKVEVRSAKFWRDAQFLLDWTTEELKPTQVPYAKGALFSLCFPLDPIQTDFSAAAERK